MRQNEWRLRNFSRTKDRLSPAPPRVDERIPPKARCFKVQDDITNCALNIIANPLMEAKVGPTLQAAESASVRKSIDQGVIQKFQL